MGIYAAQIDAFTGVFKKASMRTVCDFLHISEYMTGFYDDVVPKYSFNINGSQVTFSFVDILFSVSSVEFDLIRELHGDFENFEFSYIRISLMGKGLDFLRDLGITVDGFDSILRKLPPNFNLTRVDFAFDFVNYVCDTDNDIFSKFDNFTRKKGDNLSDTGRLVIHGHQSGIGFTKRYGASERTFYIGTPSSDRLLRVYDKYLERKTANNGIFGDGRFGDPDTVHDWTRIEWQLRNTAAMKILYATDFTFEGVLKEIYTFYQIYSKSNNCEFKSWQNYFNPNIILKNLTPYEQNLPFVSKCEKRDNYIMRNIPIIASYCASYGFEKLQKDIENYINYIQTALPDQAADQHRQLQLYTFTKRLCEISGTGDLAGVKFLSIENGRMKIKCKPADSVQLEI